MVLLYNPFGGALIRKVLNNVESALAGRQRRVFVVSYTPEYSGCFDASCKLHRRSRGPRRTPPMSSVSSPDSADAVVIWEPDHGTPQLGSEARIVVTVPGVRCELAGQTE